MSFECRLLNNQPELEEQLALFFKHIGNTKFFHPHPFTDSEAARICRYNGKDFYYVMMHDKKILGYGMLRGWAEGYDIPSLGIIIHPDFFGLGLGKFFMRFLHVSARLQGAHTIRLKVYPDNKIALNLYKSLGYAFNGESEQNQLLGMIQL